jgi:hypothetical protein
MKTYRPDAAAEDPYSSFTEAEMDAEIERLRSILEEMAAGRPDEG